MNEHLLTPKLTVMLIVEFNSISKRSIAVHIKVIVNKDFR